MFGVACPGCQKELGFVQELSGRIVSCPDCRRRFVMRQPRSLANRRQSSRLTWRPAVALSAMAGLLLCFAAVGDRSPLAKVADPSKRLVREFHGTGDADTPIFVVKDDWEIEYEVRGNLGWIGIRDPALPTTRDEPLKNIVISFPTYRETKGSILRFPGGRYSLRTMYATGPWRIRVFQHPGHL